MESLTRIKYGVGDYRHKPPESGDSGEQKPNGFATKKQQNVKHKTLYRMYKALHISPMIPSFNIQETSEFFQNVFGFTVFMDGNYIILRKDDITLHILPAGDIGEMEFYLEVNDVDAVWDSIKDKVGDLKVKEPFDRAYGMREIHVIIPHTKTLMFVGQVNS